MPDSPALKNFKNLWTDSCKTMWIEVAALRHLESTIKGQFSTLPKTSVLTDWIYAPECRQRIDDSTPTFFLDQMSRWITSAATPRIVLLAAGFEAYFEEFLDAYLRQRPKYFAAGVPTPTGNKVRGEILKCRGLVARIEALPIWTTTKIGTIAPDLHILDDVYMLRNTIAHDAGIVDTHTAARLRNVPAFPGQQLQINPEQIAQKLAPPIIRIAEALDAKIPLPKIRPPRVINHPPVIRKVKKVIPSIPGQGEA